MKIIVIGYTSYKEKDIIVNAISEDGPISFKARGALGPNSAFAWLTNPLVVAEVSWVENVRYRHQILKEAMYPESPISDKVSEYNPNTFKILVTHQPISLEKLKGYPIDLEVA